MAKKNSNQVSPSGTIPNNPNPGSGKGIPFSLTTGYNVDSFWTNEWGDSVMGMENPEVESPQQESISFNPVYYPDRYSDTMEKEVDRDGRQCGGEDVSIDKTKNPEFHATGIVLDGNMSDFRKVRKHKGPLNLITPLTDNEGGMEVIVTKGEVGEIVGWDGLYKQWQFSYTLDMVATGSDTDESEENQIVNEVLEEYREQSS